VGQEIAQTRFSEHDHARFARSLADETALLEDWLREGRFRATGHTVGFELEAWLIDRNCFPLPSNEAFLARLASPLVVPELSKFNVELNGTPQVLAADAFARMEVELTRTWRRCLEVAHELEGTLIMIGILPTVRERDLTLANISPLNRYYALNRQVLERRGRAPLRIDIRGRENLELTHADVMLEAATTSFQVHLQAPSARIVRYFNAASILSGPLVALAANAPFLFGADLWDESRIPLFEQAVDSAEGTPGQARRVTFGEDYLHASAHECFAENLARFAPLLPMRIEDGVQRLDHLRLHNGTIWRWNRLLIGFDGDAPHLRIEQRAMPAGPSVRDMVANAAVYAGASRILAQRLPAPESELPFEQARENFYRCARHGLSAQVRWLDGRERTAAALLRDEILPMAGEGLSALGIDARDIGTYLDVARARVRSGQNGASWQRLHAHKHARDLFRLTADYLEHQRSAMPVHEWPV
jgi:hypothetical protein